MSDPVPDRPLISSLANERVRFLRRLHAADERRRHRLFLLEGVRLVAEALAAGVRPVLILYVPEDLARTPRGQALLEQLPGLPAFPCTERVLQAVATTVTPQGIVSVVAVPPAPSRLTGPLAVVLDAWRDPGNVGTLLRTAEASGLVGGVFLVDCVDAYNPKVVRAAMGAHFYLPLWSDATWAEVRQHLAGRPVWLAAVREGLPYDQVDWTRPAALIVGSEAHGPGPEARAIATGQVHIPMGGRAESLNAAIAAAIIIFEAARQRRQRQTIQTAPATTERGRSGTAQGEGVAD